MNRPARQSFRNGDTIPLHSSSGSRPSSTIFQSFGQPNSFNLDSRFRRQPTIPFRQIPEPQQKTVIKRQPQDLFSNPEFFFDSARIRERSDNIGITGAIQSILKSPFQGNIPHTLESLLGRNNRRARKIQSGNSQTFKKKSLTDTEENQPKLTKRVNVPEEKSKIVENPEIILAPQLIKIVPSMIKIPTREVQKKAEDKSSFKVIHLRKKRDIKKEENPIPVSVPVPVPVPVTFSLPTSKRIVLRPKTKVTKKSKNAKKSKKVKRDLSGFYSLTHRSNDRSRRQSPFGALFQPRRNGHRPINQANHRNPRHFQQLTVQKNVPLDSHPGKQSSNRGQTHLFHPSPKLSSPVFRNINQLPINDHDSEPNFFFTSERNRNEKERLIENQSTFNRKFSKYPLFPPLDFEPNTFQPNNDDHRTEFNFDVQSEKRELPSDSTQLESRNHENKHSSIQNQRPRYIELGHLPGPAPPAHILPPISIRPRPRNFFNNRRVKRDARLQSIPIDFHHTAAYQHQLKGKDKNMTA